jgi:hypothetical protein
LKDLAPIGVSTYSRINHLKQTIEALQKNTLAKESEIYIFSDAPKKGDEEIVAKVREYIHTIDGFKKVHILERNTNSRVKNNRGGIRELLDKYGRMIFLEDDVATAPGFLQFMNDALNFYKNYSNILSVSGHTPNLSYFNDVFCDIYLSKRFHGWGVGFWHDKYNLIKDIPSWSEIKRDQQTIQNLKDMGRDMVSMIQSEADHRIDALDIKACYLCAKYGYTNVLPTKTLVKNIGMDNSGVHCSDCDPFFNDLLSNKRSFIMIEDLQIDYDALVEYKRFFSKKRPLLKILQQKIKRFW